MARIFVISLHRCATQSTALFIGIAGIRALHWAAAVDGVDYQSKIIGAETDPARIVEILRPVLDGVEALADVPLPAIYQELDASYPNAKFIAVRRDPLAWLRSVRRHCASRALDPYECAQYWRYLPDRPPTLDGVTDAALVQMFQRHYQEVASHFEGRDKLLLVDLADPDIGRKLASFLNVLPARFPHVDGRGEQIRPGDSFHRQGRGLRHTISVNIGPIGNFGSDHDA